MKKTIVTTILCLATIWAMAGNGKGPCGVYLLVNGESQNYRLNSETWWGNALADDISRYTELNGVNLETIKSLRLCGGVSVAWQNGGDYHDETSFSVKYRVYKQGETAGDYLVLALNERTGQNDDNTNVQYKAQNKDIDLRALTDGRGGTWVLEMCSRRVAHKSNGTDEANTSSSYKATFYLPEHYYVAGNSAEDANNNWCGGEEHAWWKDWSGNEIESGSKTFYNVAPGSYEFKVTNGYWNSESVKCNEYSYSDINNEECDINVHGSAGADIKFTTDAVSDITIHFDARTAKVSVTSTLGRFVRLPYSVVGDPVLSINWDPENTATEMTRQEDGTYRYTIQNIDLDAHNGRKFKIVGGHSWGTYQAPAEGDFTVDIPENGTYDLVFDFDPSTNLATCTPMLHHDVTISSYGYSTFYSDKAWTLPAGLAATIFTEVNGTALVGQNIDLIPANTGVLLNGTANATYTLLQTTTDVTYADNLFMGTTTEQTIANNGKVHYILSLHDGQCGLFWPYGTTEGVGAFTNNAGKAYLELSASAAPARVRGFILDGTNISTAVEDVAAETDNTVYDLLGRKITTPQPGNVYICNGKKVVVF